MVRISQKNPVFPPLSKFSWHLYCSAFFLFSSLQAIWQTSTSPLLFHYTVVLPSQDIFPLLTAATKLSPSQFQLLNNSQESLYIVCQQSGGSESQAFLLVSVVRSYSLLSDWATTSPDSSDPWLLKVWPRGRSRGSAESCPVWQGRCVIGWKLDRTVELAC